VEIMRGENLSLARAACESLLDRGFGKPVQSVGFGPDSVPVQGITVTFVSPDVPAPEDARE